MSLEEARSTDPVERFVGTVEERSLAESVTVRPATAIAGTLSERAREPIVAAPLPFEGISYDDLDHSVTLLPSPTELEAARTGITAAGLGVGNYGTVTIRSTPGGEEFVSLYPERHLVVLAASDIVSDMPAAFDRLATEFDDGRTSQVLATGPSATGDMGSLVRGVHGPQDVHLVIVEDR